MLRLWTDWPAFLAAPARHPRLEFSAQSNVIEAAVQGQGRLVQLGEFAMASSQDLCAQTSLDPSFAPLIADFVAWLKAELALPHPGKPLTQG